jgi:hypothetical protein
MLLIEGEGHPRRATIACLSAYGPRALSQTIVDSCASFCLRKALACRGDTPIPLCGLGS